MPIARIETPLAATDRRVCLKSFTSLTEPTSHAKQMFTKTEALARAPISQTNWAAHSLLVRRKKLQPVMTVETPVFARVAGFRR